MSRLLDDERDELDQLLGSSHPGKQDLARFVTALRATHVRPPDPAVEAEHVAAMAAAAKAIATGSQAREPAGEADAALLARPGTRWSPAVLRARFAAPAARLLATAAVAFAALAGLAVAGVNLPEPARGVAKALGLAHQEDDSPASRVLGEQPPPARPGCEFGQTVAKRASDGKVAAADPCDRRGQDSRDDRSDADGSGSRGDSRSTRGTERSRFGQETAARARRQREASGQQRRQFGQDTAARARRGSRGRSQGSADQAPPADSSGGGYRPSVTPGGPPSQVPSRPPAGGPSGSR